MQPAPFQKKIIVVGDVSGKSATIKTYTHDEFCETYVTIFDKFETDVEVDGTYIEAEIIDTTCGDKFSSIRRQMYANADVVIIFFSVYSRKSYSNVREVWVPEVTSSCSGVPYILVGTKGNIKLSDGATVDFEEGRALAEEIGADSYVECWPDRKHNVEKVFVEAISAALKRKKSSSYQKPRR